MIMSFNFYKFYIFINFIFFIHLDNVSSKLKVQSVTVKMLSKETEPHYQVPLLSRIALLRCRPGGRSNAIPWPVETSRHKDTKSCKQHGQALPYPCFRGSDISFQQCLTCFVEVFIKPSKVQHPKAGPCSTPELVPAAPRGCHELYELFIVSTSPLECDNVWCHDLSDVMVCL